MTSSVGGAFQTSTGLPDNCIPNIILKYIKHKTLTNWLNSKDDFIPQDIIDTINGDISDDNFLDKGKPRQYNNVPTKAYRVGYNSGLTLLFPQSGKSSPVIGR